MDQNLAKKLNMFVHTEQYNETFVKYLISERDKIINNLKLSKTPDEAFKLVGSLNLIDDMLNLKTKVHKELSRND